MKVDYSVMATNRYRWRMCFGWRKKTKYCTN